MANRRRQNYIYSLVEIERLKAIQLPEKIKCGRCDKFLGRARYSENQLTDLRWQYKNGPRPLKSIPCQKCAGGNQLVELECTMCHKTKGLEDFARSQRKVPDTAKCFTCTEDQVTHQPYNEENYEDATKPFVTRDTFNGVTPDYWSSSSSTFGSSASGDWSAINGGDSIDSDGGVALSDHFQQAVSMNASVADSLIGSEYSAYPGGVDHGNTSEAGMDSWYTRSTGPASTGVNGSATSSVNPSGYGRPSATSNIGTERTYASSVAERSAVSDVCSNGRPGISQGPSTPPNVVHSPFVRPAGDTERELEADTDPWNCDSDEDEYADDDSDDSDGDHTII